MVIYTLLNAQKERHEEQFPGNCPSVPVYTSANLRRFNNCHGNPLCKLGESILPSIGLHC